ncbi:MAG TPA: hypothetical protein VHB02_17395 [Acidimicrobiales bacterium]|nr:hypothetical protein [Acidimicrobiales bacterium]
MRSGAGVQAGVRPGGVRYDPAAMTHRLGTPLQDGLPAVDPGGKPA